LADASEVKQMVSVDVTIATLLVVVTLGVASFFGWRQFWQIRRLKIDTPSSEQQFMLRVARRRLVISVLLVLVAIGIATLYVSGLEEAIRVLHEMADPEKRQTAKLYVWIWLSILVILLAIVTLVGIDLWDVRRHWRQSLQQIRDERREMMDEQLAKLRDEHRRAQLDPERN